MSTPGGNQKVIFINESGLYSLILSSKLPQAKAFKRWVTSEVLPQDRPLRVATAAPCAGPAQRGC
nr:Bro-N domain-containing protein [uncultured Prevotella sp.]